MSTPATATTGTSSIAGRFVLNATVPGRTPADVTWVRGVPTKINSYSWSDPYGPKQMSVTFPGITIFDKIGYGDLEWLQRDANIDLHWITPNLPASYPYGVWRWEGYAESFTYGDDGLTVDIKGAMYQVDNYQAKPEYPSRPIPYEHAIGAWFRGRPDLRLSMMRTVFPSWWNTTFDLVAQSKKPLYLVPTGLHTGDKWTGLTTRSTGSWEPALSSYIQTLLSSMYTDRGRWTLDLLPGRIPVLTHRDFATTPLAGHLIADPAQPGVKVSVTEDFSQSLNAVFGAGKSASGISYTGQQVTGDASDTVYVPLAQLRQVENKNRNGWFDSSVMRREIVLQLQQGLEEDDARAVATSHLQHFAEPGLTGTITLESDVLITLTTSADSRGVVTPASTVLLSRMLVRPGMTILVPNLLGKPEGVFFHIAEVQVSPESGSVQLTVDTKYRDALTVAEVRLRGRDSLSIQRSLIGGAYAPPVSDQLIPWNYSAGSGYIPHSVHLSSVPLFRGMPDTVLFPWEEWTTQRPPKMAAYRNSYIHIGPKSSNANNNWAVYPTKGAGYAGFPIRLSQSGSIRLLEVAAYDKDGHVFPVPFHISFYLSRGVGVQAMPMLRAVDKPNGGYAVAQHYPYFDTAWEQYNADGTKITSEQPTTVSSAGLIRAYGTGKVPAGYWPGYKPSGDSPTGLLVDEAAFDYDLTTDASAFAPQLKVQPKFSGTIWCMIYCDGQGANDVYFVGRMYRVEPGTGA
jgi:hypothetical protein